MSKSRDGAFAAVAMVTDGRDIKRVEQVGLTKRELIAAMAMQTMATKDRGEYSQNDLTREDHLSHPRWVAAAAVDYADALLAELAMRASND